MKNLFVSFCIVSAAMLAGCSERVPLDEGVSLELARWRKARYAEVGYNLLFSIPAQRDRAVEGWAEIRVTMEKKAPLVLDFTGRPEDIDLLVVNGKSFRGYELRNQHIYIPRRKAVRGENVVTISFTAQEQSLNRRDEFLYTLLVPDRARTVFPCFEQPDLKARFVLTLDIPEGWEAVANGTIREETDKPAGVKRIIFNRTEPISTYLFSFVAGEFERETMNRGGREVSLLHRETDRTKRRQCGEILGEVFAALEWMEYYTAIPYPFEKYDLVILPGFQYGGMEHMGATLYNDRRMFLESNATDAERLARSALIAHETAHMWFGDYVTMEWFDDVWNKEVFANWFAAQIVEPMYPEVNHDLNFVRAYVPPAYGDDRTGGTVPIQQSLGNLSNAGLVYGNIIYNKSPLVMEMLVDKIGPEKFREGLQGYLKTYAYGNADWDGLIAILDGLTAEDLTAWSDVWVREKGMPFISMDATAGDKRLVRISQRDPWGRGVTWEQPLKLAAVMRDGTRREIDISLGAEPVTVDEPGALHLLPNSDGRAYGYFRTPPETTNWLLKNWMVLPDEVLRFSMLTNLYEGVMNCDIPPADFMKSALKGLPIEPDFQLFCQVISYAENVMKFLPDFVKARIGAEFESLLFTMARSGAERQRRVVAAQTFVRIVHTKEGLDRLYELWSADRGSDTRAFGLSESELISASYKLAIYFPEHAADIVATQLSRITNPDRRAEYEFVSRAVAPSQSERDALFESLLDPANRTVEPWALQALRLLNHPARQEQAVKYIGPALDVLEEVQRTGDIFFPANWCAALLEGHISGEAAEQVRSFLEDHPDMPEMLAGKIRLKSDHFLIAAGTPEERYHR